MYMLTNVDRQGRSVFHLACENGLNTGLRFLIQKAYDFGVLQHVLNQETDLGKLPLYFLCHRGYKADEFSGRTRLKQLHLLLRGPCPDDDPYFEREDGTRDRHKTYCDWTAQVPQTKYTCLHWLAYHNDWMSLKYLLALCLDINDAKYELKMVRKCMRANSDDMTPLDIAGKNGCIRSAIIIINYFKEMFGVLAERFNRGDDDEGESLLAVDGERIDHMSQPPMQADEQIKIKHVCHKSLSKF